MNFEQLFKAFSLFSVNCSLAIVAYHSYQHRRLQRIERAEKYLDIFKNDPFIQVGKRIIDNEKHIQLPAVITEEYGEKTLDIVAADVANGFRCAEDSVFWRSASQKINIIHGSLDACVAYLADVHSEIEYGITNEQVLKNWLKEWVHSCKDMKLDEYAAKRGYPGAVQLMNRWILIK